MKKYFFQVASLALIAPLFLASCTDTDTSSTDLTTSEEPTTSSVQEEVFVEATAEEASEILYTSLSKLSLNLIKAGSVSAMFSFDTYLGEEKAMTYEGHANLDIENDYANFKVNATIYEEEEPETASMEGWFFDDEGKDYLALAMESPGEVEKSYGEILNFPGCMALSVLLEKAYEDVTEEMVLSAVSSVEDYVTFYKSDVEGSLKATLSMSGLEEQLDGMDSVEVTYVQKDYLPVSISASFASADESMSAEVSAEIAYGLEIENVIPEGYAEWAQQDPIDFYSLFE